MAQTELIKQKRQREESGTLLYSDLTEPQRQVICWLAEANDLWLPAEGIHSGTLSRLQSLDLIFISTSTIDTRLKLTGRGRKYYENILCASLNRYADDELRRIIQLAQSGMIYIDIAVQIGCSESYVGLVMRGKFNRSEQLLKEMGCQPIVKIPRQTGKQRRVIQLRKQGASYDDIANKLGVSHGTINRWLKQAGMVTKGHLSNEERHDIIKMAQAGMTYDQIAHKIGRSRRPVTDTMKAFYSGKIKR